MTRPSAMPSSPKPVLTPKRRFQAFRNTPGWDAKPGDELFDQINNREAPAGLPILAITQEHGAIPRDHIDYHVSVTDKSVETYKEVYGKLSESAFEVHHRKKLGGLKKAAKTKLSDLGILCASCHRVIHRITPMPTISRFENMIKSSDEGRRGT